MALSLSGNALRPLSADLSDSVIPCQLARSVASPAFLNFSILPVSITAPPQH
jgi:hypothetical protein